MLPTRTRIVLVVVLLLGLFLRATSYTSADLFAERVVERNLFSMTTLSFGQLNTANNDPVSRLFEVSRIVPSGFAVDSVRIKKVGLLNFKYRLKTELRGESTALCHSLQLKLVENNTIRATGNAVDFSYESAINSNAPEDMVFYVGLDDSNPDLRNKVCEFNLVFATYRDGESGRGGIWAETKLSNYVSSGNWD